MNPTIASNIVFICEKSQSNFISNMLTNRLYGPGAAMARHLVLKQLGSDLPKSKCGHGMVVKALVDELGIPPDCSANIERQIDAAIRGLADLVQS